MKKRKPIKKSTYLILQYLVTAAALNVIFIYSAYVIGDPIPPVVITVANAFILTVFAVCLIMASDKAEVKRLIKKKRAAYGLSIANITFLAEKYPDYEEDLLRVKGALETADISVNPNLAPYEEHIHKAVIALAGAKPNMIPGECDRIIKLITERNNRASDCRTPGNV